MSLGRDQLFDCREPLAAVPIFSVKLTLSVLFLTFILYHHDNNHSSNECISRAPFHVKHAQLR